MNDDKRLVRGTLPRDPLSRDALRFQRTGDRAARDRVFAAAAPLLRGAAWRYCPPGADPADLVQELTFAVHDALRTYRPDRGARFATFLLPWINKYARVWRDRERLIYIPDHALRNARTENRMLPWCEIGLEERSSGDGGDSPTIRANGTPSPSPRPTAAASSAAAPWASAAAPDFASSVVDDLALADWLEHLRLLPRDRELLLFLASGATIHECALQFGLSRQRVAQRLAVLRPRLQTVLEREQKECRRLCG